MNDVSSALGLAALLICLTVRLLFTFVVVLRAGFNLKEKVFIALAWMPKATVQVNVEDVCVSSDMTIIHNSIIKCAVILNINQQLKCGK